MSWHDVVTPLLIVLFQIPISVLTDDVMLNQCGQIERELELQQTKEMLARLGKKADNVEKLDKSGREVRRADNKNGTCCCVCCVATCCACGSTLNAKVVCFELPASPSSWISLV